MSQEDVRRLLLELGGEATDHELVDLAREKWPERRLDSYLSERLQSLEKKGFVKRSEGDTMVWRLTEKGREETVDFSVDDLDRNVTGNKLREMGFEVANVVGSLRLERELDLHELNADIPNSEYEPERYPSLIYRVEGEGNMSVLTPSSGRLAITGADSKEQLYEGTREFIDTLEQLGIQVDKTAGDLLIQNLVASYDLSRELDLNAVAVALGFENIEYEPEQFPGLIYRTSGNTTVLMFRSGKMVITGARTYLEVVEAKDEVIDELVAIGVEFK